MSFSVSTEKKLKERIKELTCLYEVSSYISNCDLNYIKPTLVAIAKSLKKAIQFPKDATVSITANNFTVSDESIKKDVVYMICAIKSFNKNIGAIKVGYLKKHYTSKSFLNEEEQLLKKIALEIGGLFERKEILEKEALTRRQIERADRLSILGEITAGIAHELNTPLANILGYSELLKEQFTNNNKAINDLNKIITNAEFSSEVVKKLMFFSCEMPQQMAVTNITPIVKNAISLLKPNFTKKQIQCHLEIEKESICMRVDSIQLTQVLFNLVINAIYFSPVKGQIWVCVYEKNNDVVIEIRDEGPGIQKSQSNSIFNPFYTTKPLGEGSGLGLSVVHGIVKSHKGEIKHQPNSPKGTVFTVHFPKQ
ncbi:sensor histidine kinase [Seonamhaeicola sp. S2-3]|uniref:sensor histidine kinase n=1 Tax=Seonamhaeicola sp. S2-3 TaxID=1936081 RepID=UPI0009728D56|nr:HAMP domain-containing sensor histidine kinase [Seonamhaeicola sp. S2-3]APY11729.1 sensor histidine kinase [Seonamhaeicola sp. S2-3]